jgi:lipid II:glycine glycyltransferase (peptidoglycan interpeptide bridge formation enzyme)
MAGLAIRHFTAITEACAAVIDHWNSDEETTQEEPALDEGQARCSSRAASGRGMKSMLDIEVDDAPSHPEWDAWLATAPGGHHLQTSGWGYVKAGSGWHATRFLLRRCGDLVGGCQLLTRAAPVLGGVGYVPRGPVFTSQEADLVDTVLAALREHARRHRLAVVKIQPPVDRADLPGLLELRGLIASGLHTAPAASVVVDVGPGRDEEAIFRGFRATTRRRVRQARKQGVTVRAGGSEDLPVLQAILEATAKRQNFAPYPADYYQRLWTAFGTSGHARLLVTEHEGVALSAVLLVAFGDTVIYKIGGWADLDGAPPGVNELAHWSAIEWAHHAGYRYYDLEGIPVELAQAMRAGDRAEPRGVAFFKLGFGGEVVLYPGTYDLLPDGLRGAALRYLLPRAERWRGVVQRLVGRR